MGAVLSNKWHPRSRLYPIWMQPERLNGFPKNNFERPNEEVRQSFSFGSFNLWGVLIRRHFVGLNARCPKFCETPALSQRDSRVMIICRQSNEKGEEVAADNCTGLYHALFFLLLMLFVDGRSAFFQRIKRFLVRKHHFRWHPVCTSFSLFPPFYWTVFNFALSFFKKALVFLFLSLFCFTKIFRFIC